MAAHQAPPSLGFSRQEHWSGLPFPSPVHERESESEVTQSCSILSNPIDCSLPGSSVHGIFQARVLEWVALAFSISIHSEMAGNPITIGKQYGKNGYVCLQKKHCLWPHLVCVAQDTMMASAVYIYCWPGSWELWLGVQLKSGRRRFP